VVRFKVLRLVVSHVHLYSKLEEFGKNYDATVKATFEQDNKWLSANEEENDSSMSESDSQQTDTDELETETIEKDVQVTVVPRAPLQLSPSNGQKITIDNIDYRKEVHYMTTEHQNEDVHYLTMSATTNRVHGNHLSSTTPVGGLKDMYNGLCIPNHLEQSAQRDNYITLIEKIIVNNVPCLGFLKDVVTQHIPHRYSQETKSPTETVSLNFVYLN
jgi:hypothetical protein